MQCHSERSEDELLRTCPKNLNTSTCALQILRIAQDDMLIGENHFDTSFASLWMTNTLIHKYNYSWVDTT